MHGKSGYEMNTKSLALILAFSILGIGIGSAGEKVWVGLYLAENTPPAPGARLATEKMHQRLFAVFGFKHYELVQAQEIELAHEWQQWAVPRKDFFLRLLPLHRQPGEPRLIDYEIYNNGAFVAKGTYEPHPDTPLFINGPGYKQGQFIFVLEKR